MSSASQPVAILPSSTIHLGSSGLAKRSACDRCRRQKLRCNRNEHESSPCFRCTRAKAECFTSPPKSTGRPARAKGHISNIRKSDPNLRTKINRSTSTVLSSTYPHVNGAVPTLSSQYANECASGLETTSPMLSSAVYLPNLPLKNTETLGNHCTQNSQSGLTSMLYHPHPQRSQSIPWTSTSRNAPVVSERLYQASISAGQHGQIPSFGQHARHIELEQPNLRTAFGHSGWDLDLQNVNNLSALASSASRTSICSPFGPDFEESSGDDIDAMSASSETDLVEYCVFQLYDVSRDISRQLKLIEVHNWSDLYLEGTFNNGFSCRNSNDTLASPIESLFQISAQLLDVIYNSILPHDLTRSQQRMPFTSVQQPDSASRDFKRPYLHGEAQNLSYPSHEPCQIFRGHQIPSSPVDLPSFAGVTSCSTSSAPPRPARGRPNSTVVLLALSCYNQIRSLYSSLFMHIEALLQVAQKRVQSTENANISVSWPNEGTLKRVLEITDQSIRCLEGLKRSLGLSQFSAQGEGTGLCQIQTFSKYVKVMELLGELDLEGQYAALGQESLEDRIRHVQTLLLHLRSDS